MSTKLGVNVTGLDKFQRELEEAQRAIKSLDGRIATVKFDAADPADIQRAIRDTEAAVDSKVARYRNNPLVATVAKGAKETFHKNMLDQAKKK